MKKILIILGLFFLGTGIISMTMFFYVSHFGPKLDETSKAYVDEVVPIIVFSWNSEELIKRVSPEILKSVSEKDIYNFFSDFSKKFGNLKKYKKAEGGANIHFSLFSKVVTATYFIDASFEKGDAQIKIDLIQHNDKWQILGFYVNLN